MLMLPEIVVIATAMAVLCVDLLIDEKRRVALAPLALAGLAVAFVATVLQYPAIGSDMFGGRYALDSVGWWFKLIFILATLLTVGISLDSLDGRGTVPSERLPARGEYYVAMLFTLSGMMFMVSARDLVMLYVSLELATIPLFALTAWRRDSLSGEAGLKYVIIGALGSAILLYGFSFFYGLTGETALSAISAKLTALTPAYILAAAMVTAGIGFKMTLVPSHMWAADVYQGAPTPVTAYLSVASKGAGLALMFQVFYRTMGHLVNDWTMVIAVVATATMTLGNLVAIVQQDIKRFMAFSSISQAGYLVMGFLGPAPEGVPAMLYYLLVYVVTNLAVFAVIIFHSNQTGSRNVEDYRGLSRTNPAMALAMMLALFSLAGIPPLAGFVGKFFLFSVAAKAGLNWLVAVAAVNSTISLYYYLRIVRQMYIEPAVAGATALRVTPAIACVTVFSVAATILTGVIPFFYELVHADTVKWLALVVR
ncbi:MAG: NADH-quinone oxidoreductase subunit N [bacterium]